MNAHEPPRLTSESRVLRNGQIGGWVDGRSPEGRFLARIERSLVAELGGSTTFAQKLLIRRAARAMLRLELLDEKAAAGNWTDHDARTFGGLSNSVRLLLREVHALSVGKGKAKAGALSDIISRHSKASAS